MRVRSPARLNGRDLFRLRHVRDVEDADAAEPFGADRLLYASRAAVDAPARLLDGHEQQVAVNRKIALTAGADDRRDQARLRGGRDVVDVEAVEIADEQLVAPEGHVRVPELEAGPPRRPCRILLRRLLRVFFLF